MPGMQAPQLSYKQEQKNNAERIEMMKYCKWCHKHTLHKETK